MDKQAKTYLGIKTNFDLHPKTQALVPSSSCRWSCRSSPYEKQQWGRHSGLWYNRDRGSLEGSSSLLVPTSELSDAQASGVSLDLREDAGFCGLRSLVRGLYDENHILIQQIAKEGGSKYNFYTNKSKNMHLSLVTQHWMYESNPITLLYLFYASCMTFCALKFSTKAWKYIWENKRASGFISKSFQEKILGAVWVELGEGWVQKQREGGVKQGDCREMSGGRGFLQSHDVLEHWQTLSHGNTHTCIHKHRHVHTAGHTHTDMVSILK